MTRTGIGHQASGIGRELPSIGCGRLENFDERSLPSVRAAFAAAAEVSLDQAWRETLEEHFAPASVRTGWRDDALFVFAELTDADVFTAATDHNQAFWELGDTFEIFLRPEEQDAYVELHVSPNNLHLHLRFPDAGFLARTPPADVFGHALRAPDAFESRVWIDDNAGSWAVLARIPANVVCEGGRLLEGSRWRFSFSRYDFTRGRANPVISSSSPHQAPAFHRQQEWGVLRFEP